MQKTGLDIPARLRELARKSAELEIKKLAGERRGFLTGGDIRAIEAIGLYSADKGAPLISEAAKALGVSRPSATAMINRLEIKGFAEKTASQGDGRSVAVKLTAKGEKIFAAIEKYNREFTMRLAEKLGKEELEGLSGGLERLDAVLSEMLTENG